MNHDALYRAIDAYVRDLPRLTHVEMTSEFESLGLPNPEGSKNERARQCADSLSTVDLQGVASKLLERRDLEPQYRKNIEEALWHDSSEVPEISKRVRHQIAKNVSIYDLYGDAGEFMNLLDQLWITDGPDLIEAISGLMGQPVVSQSLRAQVERHVLRNDDWSTWDLFRSLGAFDSSDRRFALFLEGLCSGKVTPDESSQRVLVEKFNTQLKSANVGLVEVDVQEGYPRFGLLRTGDSHKRPKNIIFGCTTKPDIRFKSAIDNEIEIVGDQDAALVFDSPLTGAGLTWLQLQEWWSEDRKISDQSEAKNSLYARLRTSLPTDSPPQKDFFWAYHNIFKESVPRLPALLPEVWFCWDPKTVKARGRDALLRSRMDFLLLLPGRVRIAIEIDGKYHYTSDGVVADSRIYARNVASDRDLKLSGYDVYRFGTYELRSKEVALETVSSFFNGLYSKYDVRAVGAL